MKKELRYFATATDKSGTVCAGLTTTDEKKVGPWTQKQVQRGYTVDIEVKQITNSKLLKK